MIMSNSLTDMEEMDIAAHALLCKNKNWQTALPSYRVKRIIDALSNSGIIIELYTADFNCLIDYLED